MASTGSILRRTPAIVALLILLLPSSARAQQAALEGVDGLDSGRPVLRVRVTNTTNQATDPKSTSIVLQSMSKPESWTDVRTPIPPLGPGESAVVTLPVGASLAPGSYRYSVLLDISLIDRSTTQLLTGAFDVPNPPVPIDLWIAAPRIVRSAGKPTRLVATVGNHGPQSAIQPRVHAYSSRYWKAQDRSFEELDVGETTSVAIDLRSDPGDSLFSFRLAIFAGPEARDQDTTNNVLRGMLGRKIPGTPWTFPWPLLIGLVILTVAFSPPVAQRLQHWWNPPPHVRVSLASIAHDSELRETSQDSWELTTSVESVKWHVSIQKVATEEGEPGT